MSSTSRIPIIDIAALLAGTPADEEAVAQTIGRACRDIGFFYVTGHGIPAALLAEVFRQSAAFFAAPRPIQDPVRYSGPAGNRGHIPLGAETLEPGTPPDHKECYNIGLDLAADDPELLAGKPFRHRNPWPDLPGFRETMLDYFGRVHRLGWDIRRPFAIDLGLDRLFFEGKLDRPMAILRLLHYPAVEGVPPAGRMGAGEHTDYGNLTLLAVDEVKGLVVRMRSGDWIEAPRVPGALICNIGDCLMRWTNDTYVSTPHRVTSPHACDRYSVVFFLDPNPDAVVACIPSCVRDGVAHYPPIVAADYLLSRLVPTYEKAG